MPPTADSYSVSTPTADSDSDSDTNFHPNDNLSDSSEEYIDRSRFHTWYVLVSCFNMSNVPCTDMP